MTLGLKRGVVELADHDPEWEQIARETIGRLWRVFGSVAKDIQHVGSTAIKNIKAKPIIDIAVAVDDFSNVETLTPTLEAEGFMRRNWAPNENEQMLYAIGYDAPPDDRVTTHFIHIVRNGSMEHTNYINFRDYLNANVDIAKEYETIKVRFATENPYDPGREKYLAGKHDFIIAAQQAARIWVDFNKRFIKIEPITKGWSEDKKYCVTATDGTKYLLRITPISRYEVRKSLFAMLERVTALGIPMCVPVEFGTCDDGVYSLQSWIDGEDLETVLPLLSETEQYVLGLKSGKVLRIMHAIPAPETQEEWELRFNKKIDRNIALNENCIEEGFVIDGLEYLYDFVQSNRHLLKNRPQCFQHGDYHVGNMMLESGELKIIDFDRYDFGDPWEEFNRMTFNASASPHFATGLLRGYFDGEPPLEFFKLQAFYIASTHLAGLSWARKFGESEIIFTKKQVADILCWFDNMKNPVPTWYLKDFYIQWIDGVPYKLKAPFNFSFLSKYGKVFRAFDEQGSGNIAFGVQNEDKKFFIKFAGSPKENYIANRDSGTVDAASAIEFLKRAIPIYVELAHPTLIKYVEAEEIGGGYAAVFEWEDAAGIEPKGSPNYMRFMQLPTEKKIRAFGDIMEFHAYVAAKGYVALDFYDGSILYDYENEKIVICDIDLYQKSPFQNAGGMGIVGSARYVSPEECVPDAVMDEITNVYTMGATAFALFAHGDRSLEKWPLSEQLYDVVKKAVSDERGKRQQSIRQLMEEWEAAKE